MEDYQLDIAIREGLRPAPSKLDLPPFTLMAPPPGQFLTSPLRDRFGIVSGWSLQRDLTSIVSRSARCLGLEMTEDGAIEVARRSRGTPLLLTVCYTRVRDFAQVKSDGPSLDPSRPVPWTCWMSITKV